MAFESWLRRLRMAALPNSARRRVPEHARYLAAAPELCEERTLLSEAPVVTLLPAGPLNYTEGSGAVVVAASSTVTDADSPVFDGGSLTVSITANGTTQDTLGINNQGTATGQIGVSGSDVTYSGTVIGTFTGGTAGTPLIVSFNANATVEAVQALQQNITFSITGDPTSTEPRTFQSVVVDAAGGNASLAATEIINVLESSPVVTLSTTELTLSNSSPTVIDSNITVTSPGATTFDGAVLSVQLTEGTSRDRLGILNHGKSSGLVRVSGSKIMLHGQVIGTFTGGAGTTPLKITFNQNATLDDVQSVARSITVRSIGHFAHQTGVAFQLSDGTGGIGTAATAMITVTHGGNPGGGNDDHGNHGGGNDDHGNHGHPNKRGKSRR